MNPKPPSPVTSSAGLQTHADVQGLVCPQCGCRHFHVVYTRRARGGKLLRRRECRHCGRRITTAEIVLEK